jgi:hypothetical protein
VTDQLPDDDQARLDTLKLPSAVQVLENVK